MLVLILFNALSGALAASAVTSLDAVSTGLLHHKSFSFEYGSDSKDDLEVDVQANSSGNDLVVNDSLVKREFENGNQGNVVWVTRYTAGSTTLTSTSTPSAVPTVPVITGAIPPVSVGPNSVPTDMAPPVPTTYAPGPVPVPDSTQTIVQVITQTQTDLQTAYLTVPQYVTVSQPIYQTVTQPFFQTVTQPVFQTIAEPVFQTVTQPVFQPVTATVTETVTVTSPGGTSPGGTDSNAYQKGYSDGLNAKCNNEFEFQSGFVNGARWAYEVGYTDGTRGKPLCVPSFYTTAQTLPGPPTVLPPAPPGYPAGRPCPNANPGIAPPPCAAPAPFYPPNPYARQVVN